MIRYAIRSDDPGTPTYQIFPNADSDSFGGFNTALGTNPALLEIPPGTFTNSAGLAVAAANLQPRLRIVGHDAVITSTGPTGTVYLNVPTNGPVFTVDGKLTFKGVGGASERGLKITDPLGVNLSNITFNAFTAGAGMELAAGAAGGGAFNSYNNLCAQNCLTGFLIDNPSEYGFWTNCRAIPDPLNLSLKCGVGFDVGAGNHQFANCQINACATGVAIRNLSNGAHGTWIGGCINHCSNAAILVEAVATGFIFSGVQILTSGSGGTIQLNGCTNVMFIGCVIGANVVMGVGCGNNYFIGCVTDGSNPTVSGDTTSVGKVVFANNYKSGTSTLWTG